MPSSPAGLDGMRAVARFLVKLFVKKLRAISLRAHQNLQAASPLSAIFVYSGLDGTHCTVE